MLYRCIFACLRLRAIEKKNSGHWSLPQFKKLDTYRQEHKSMGFLISKTLLLLSLPVSSSLSVMVAGFLLLKKHPSIGKALLGSAFLFLYILSLNPVANALMRPLETRFKPVNENSFSDIGYIVVLGSGLVSRSWLGADPAPSGTSLQRVVEGITLQRKLHGSKLVLSGGSGDPGRPELSEAEVMKGVAISLGVPPEDIIVEAEARNTLESVELLKNHFRKGEKVLLVTSAFHMGRALGMFKKNAINVFPAPTAYISEDVSFSFFSFIPDVGNLGKSSTAFYEYLCLSWYSLRGII